MSRNILSTWYRTYVRNQESINRILLLILVLLSIVAILKVLLSDGNGASILQLMSSESDKILAVSSILRNLSYFAALLLAGAWSYYVFIRSRTFQPRLMIEINLKDLCGKNKNIAIIRFTVTNIGKVKVAPLVGCATIQYGYLDNDKITYKKIAVIHDLFKYYHIYNKKLSLEPESIVNIELPIICNRPRNFDIKNNEGVHMLLIESEFLAANNRAYQEVSLFNIGPGMEIRK